MCRHMYDWNIVNCDVKQLIQLNSKDIAFTRDKGRICVSHAFNQDWSGKLI